MQRRVRLVLDLVDQLEGDDFPILMRRPPDSRVPADAELLVQHPGADRVTGGGHDVSLSGLSDAGSAASTGIQTHGMIGARRLSVAPLPAGMSIGLTGNLSLWVAHGGDQQLVGRVVGQLAVDQALGMTPTKVPPCSWTERATSPIRPTLPPP
jgi:hypothetical protein